MLYFGFTLARRVQVFEAVLKYMHIKKSKTMEQSDNQPST